MDTKEGRTAVQGGDELDSHASDLRQNHQALLGDEGLGLLIGKISVANDAHIEHWSLHFFEQPYSRSSSANLASQFDAEPPDSFAPRQHMPSPYARQRFVNDEGSLEDVDAGREVEAVVGCGREFESPPRFYRSKRSRCFIRI